MITPALLSELVPFLGFWPVVRQAYGFQGNKRHPLADGVDAIPLANIPALEPGAAHRITA